jgi:hypothetical protein
VSLPVKEVLKPMLDAVRASLAKDWKKVERYAKPEFDRLARSLRDIAALAAEGAISAAEARSLLSIHRNTTRTVLLTVEGMGVIAVEKAINAALGAVKDAVNRAAGVTVL